MSKHSPAFITFHEVPIVQIDPEPPAKRQKPNISAVNMPSLENLLEEQPKLTPVIQPPNLTISFVLREYLEYHVSNLDSFY
jgi:hypothetical protein